MKRAAHCHLRFAAAFCGLATSVNSAPASAQAPAEYHDQYINGGLLVPDITAGAQGSEDSAALAHSLQIDAVASALSSHGSGASHTVTENGFLARSQWETPHYGAWSLDASARTGSSGPLPSGHGQGSVVTLRERGVAFDGGWQADNAIGDLNSPDIDLARLQARFYLPTGPMQGLLTEWRGPENLQIVAGGGVPGVYEGLEVPDFRPLGGSTATAGAQWSPSSAWSVGGQLIQSHDANLAIGPVIEGMQRVSSTTGLATAAWKNDGERVQLNMLDGAIRGEGNALGTWVDGAMTRGRYVQNAGIFRIDPYITWGNQLISNDVQGGYYRLNYQSRQWLADVGIDEVRSVSGLGTSNTFLTADARYQLSRDWGAGGLINSSRAHGGNRWSVQGFVDHCNPAGTGRAQLDFADTPMGRDATLTLNEAWATPASMQLSTSASVERINGSLVQGLSQQSTLLRLAAFGGGHLTNRLGLEGNVSWSDALQGRAPPGISANVSITWQIAEAWELLATYYDTRVGAWTSLTVVSPLTPPMAAPVPGLQERGAFFTLRYRRASGLHFAPLGGAPGAGSGEISGMVLLDANHNGRYDAGESGAANVTVVLDGRYSVQTDATGRFDFPVVATGRHVITVVADNLPLPWMLVNEGRVELDVRTRDRTEISLAAQRPR